MSDELPSTWATAPLSDLLIALESGSRPRGGVRGISEGVPSIGGEHLKYDGRFDFSSVKFVPEDFAAEMSKGQIHTNDILVVKDGATTGKTAFVDSTFPFRNAVVNEHVFICRPVGELEPRFLFRFLMSKDGQERILDNFKGSAQGGINQSFAPNTEVPLAPLAEQRRIVAKLETLLGKVGACQQRLAKIPVLLKRFRQSVLAAACSGRLTADWREENPNVEPASNAIERMRKETNGVRVRRGVPERVPISDLVGEWQLPETWAAHSAAELLRIGAFTDVKDGNHGANHPKVSEFTDTGLPFITAAQVNNFRVDYDGAYKISGEPLERLRVGFAKAGDVIYTHKGSVGRVAIADRDCILTPQTTYYRLAPEIFANCFVMLYLASQPFSEQVDVVKEQTTRDFVPICEQYLLFHRVPPLAEQQEIVRRVEALFALADQIEARFQKAQSQVAKLTPSLLARAFRGQLVPQDPADEPAEKLLGRIQRQK